MVRTKTLQQLFRRYRRPGDLFFALAVLIFALFLLSQLGSEVKWVKRKPLIAQPGFWPALSIAGMILFASLHFLGGVLSQQIPGRYREVMVWVRSLEYAGWFLAYVLIVPWLGYLPATVVFTGLLALRAGYRSKSLLFAAMGTGVLIVVIFKSFLQVKIPAGALYEHLPDGLRAFMLAYL